MNPSQLATLVAYAIQIAQLVFKIIGVIKGIQGVPTPPPPPPVTPGFAAAANVESGPTVPDAGSSPAESSRRVRHENLRVYDPDHGGEAG